MLPQGSTAPQRDRATWSAYILTGYFAYLETILGPVIPFLRAEQGLSYRVAGLHFSAFSLGGIVVGMAGERAARRWGRAGGIRRGAAGMAVGAVVLAGGGNPVLTIGGTFVMGTSGALLLILVQSSLADRHGSKAPVAMLESNAVASAGAVLATIGVAAATAVALGWRPAVLAAAVAGTALALGLDFGPRPTPVAPPPSSGRRNATHGKEGETQAAPPRLPRRFWAFAAVLFLGVAVEWCISYWAASFLIAERGISPSVAAGAVGVWLGAMLVGRIGGSRIAATTSPPAVIIGAFILGLAGFAVFWRVGGLGPALAGLFVAGLGVSNLYPVAVAGGADAARPWTDQATARLALGGSIAIMSVPFALGALADRTGLEAAYGIVVPVTVLGVLVGGWLFLADRRHREPRAP